MRFLFLIIEFAQFTLAFEFVETLPPASYWTTGAGWATSKSTAILPGCLSPRCLCFRNRISLVNQKMIEILSHHTKKLRYQAPSLLHALTSLAYHSSSPISLARYSHQQLRLFVIKAILLLFQVPSKCSHKDFWGHVRPYSKTVAVQTIFFPENR